MINKHPWQPDAYQVELRFYDRKKKLITKYLTCDGWALATTTNAHLIDQPGEFYIHIEAQLRLKPSEAIRYSFIEVFYKGEFMQRQFIRFGQLVPFISDIEDRGACPYIREKLITNTVSLNMLKMFRQSFWGTKPVDPKLTDYC